MTSSQSSQALSRRSLSFAGVLEHALTAAQIDVVWENPGASWGAKNFDEYDVVLAGVAPVHSLTASKAYSILALIDTLYDTGKLRLFVDAPEPSKIHAGLRSIQKDSSRLVKPLYSARKDYGQVVDDQKIRKKVLSGIEILASKNWPRTFYPGLPIDQGIASAAGIPKTMSDSLVKINADSMFIHSSAPLNPGRSNYWVITAKNSKWYDEVTCHLKYPTRQAKQHRTWTDADVVAGVESSIGVLIGPHDDKLLWWSPLFIYAMNTLTPVATEWRLSNCIGKDWNHLAVAIEEMSTIDRYEVAAAQREQYLDIVRDPASVVQHLTEQLGVL